MLRSQAIFYVVLWLGYTTVLGQVDADPDGIGLYVDPGGLENSISVAPWTLFDAYLVITNPTESGVHAWCAGLGFDDGVFIHSWEYMGSPDTFNAASAPGEYQWFAGSQTSNEIGSGNVVPVLRVTMLVSDPEAKSVRVTGSPLYCFEAPTYRNWDSYHLGEPVFLTPASGSIVDPSFRINGEAPVGLCGGRLGDLKRLYR